jgi:CheY-like chemotaxis protein
MVIVLILLTVVVFVLVDWALRVTLRKMEEAKTRRERQRALDEGVRLEFAEEAKSLKRVEVDAPRARILAVDDEPVVLDSFRKILVLAGFSVDTVETGQEALALVRKRDYDFVFTDLKMPGMDGLDVTKAVKHLRPDVDLAIITGYGTIETAVSGMKYGAVDYVEKPFTEDELVDFANRLLIRRQERLARQSAPEVHLVTPSSAGVASPRVVNVPGGVYVSPEHTWVNVEINGEGRVGLDDFFHKTVGPIDTIRFPEKGKVVRRGEPLFTVGRGDWSLTFSSPLAGRVSRVNHELEFHPSLARLRPYEQGWICALEPSALTSDLERLRIGADAGAWYRQEIDTFRKALDLELGAPPPRGEETAEAAAAKEVSPRAFDACFLGSRSAAASTLRATERGAPPVGAGR